MDSKFIYTPKTLGLNDIILVYNDGISYKSIDINVFNKEPIIYDKFFEGETYYDISITHCPSCSWWPEPRVRSHRHRARRPRPRPDPSMRPVVERKPAPACSAVAATSSRPLASCSARARRPRPAASPGSSAPPLAQRPAALA